MPVVRMVKQASGLDLSASARRAKRWLGERAPVATAATQADAARALAQQVVVRATELRQQLSAQVQLYFAPSRFVLERSVLDGGLPRERMVHLPFGIADGVLGARSPRPAEAPLQIGYLGARIRAKGPDLLLRAWAQLPSELRQSGVLRVCGSDANEPTYQAELRQLALAAGARLEGVLDRAAVARLYAELDLLVVPSRWWENAPLVVQEARAAGVPLLVADHGGLAELVEPGIDGWRFRPGSVEDLSARLAQVLSRELDTRALHPRPVPAWSWHVDQVEAHYRAVVP
jgi:glycosyltransferase involved in cell wall biosynthesis